MPRGTVTPKFGAPESGNPESGTAESGSHYSGQTTRQRILEAAILRFSQHSYEGTKLRDLAADVGVDVAFVHRSFGSKEQLFIEVMKAAVRPEDTISVEKADLSATLTKRVLELSLDHTLRLVDPLDILIHSLSSAQAIPVLRKFIVHEIIEPLAAKLDDPAPQRAALAIAYLLGVKIFRDVMHIEPLLDGPTADLERLIGNVLDIVISDGNVGHGPQAPPRSIVSRSGKHPSCRPEPCPA